MANYDDVPEAGDFSDFAHVCAVPYAGAATLDRRMRHYCGIASRKLARLGAAFHYGDRLAQDLAALIRRHP
jgi:hypothetical protein